MLMPGVEKNLEQMLTDLLEVKNRHGLDNDRFLVLIGLVNLMGIINLLEGRAGDGKKGDVFRRTPPEKVPFMGMFTGPRSGAQQPEEEGR